MQVGEQCVRLSSIRRLTRRGRGALGARYRLCRKISSGLQATVAGRRWHAPNTSPRSAAPSRSRLTLIKPWYSPTWDSSALQAVPNAGALLSGLRSEPAHASRSPARLIARFARNGADSRRGAHTRSERPGERIGAQIRRTRSAGAGLALTIQIRHSEAGADARAEAVVARPGRARLDVGDCDSAPGLLGGRFRASTITRCVAKGPTGGPPRPRSRGCRLARRSGHLVPAGTRAAPYRPRQQRRRGHDGLPEPLGEQHSSGRDFGPVGSSRAHSRRSARASLRTPDTLGDPSRRRSPPTRTDPVP